MTTYNWVHLEVLMSDGREYKVAANMRHTRRAMAPVNAGGGGIRDAESDPLGWAYGLAWAYLTESGDIAPMTLDQFIAVCDFAQVVTDQDAAAEAAGVGPTSPVPGE